MSTYIAGPMSPYAFGLEETPEDWDWNHPAFEYIAGVYRQAGHDVISPAESAPAHDSCSWEDGIRECIKLLLPCDHIIMLPGWQNSRGATLEHTIAEALAMDITYLEVQ